jgi:rubrerythrin
MDIYEFAMQMEKDGRDFYLDLAKKTSNSGLKNILTMMADSEAKHYNVFLSMKKNDKTQYTADTEILTKVKNIFIKMKEEKEFDLDVSQVELYKNALEIEKKNQNFYIEKADEERDQSRKEIFLKIADEEKSHCVLLENMIGFVSQPDSWLEDSEWYHLDEN